MSVMHADDDEEFFTLQQVAAKLHMSASWVSKKASAGELAVIYWGTKARVTGSAYREFIDREREKAEALRQQRATRAQALDGSDEQTPSVGTEDAIYLVTPDPLAGLTSRSRKALARRGSP